MDQIKKELQRLLTRFSLDPYMTLGVAQDVEVNVAKKAYRKLILKCVSLACCASVVALAPDSIAQRFLPLPRPRHQVPPRQEPAHQLPVPRRAAGVRNHLRREEAQGNRPAAVPQPVQRPPHAPCLHSLLHERKLRLGVRAVLPGKVRHLQAAAAVRSSSAALQLRAWRQRLPAPTPSPEAETRWQRHRAVSSQVAVPRQAVDVEGRRRAAARGRIVQRQCQQPRPAVIVRSPRHSPTTTAAAVGHAECSHGRCAGLPGVGAGVQAQDDGEEGRGGCAEGRCWHQRKPATQATAEAAATAGFRGRSQAPRTFCSTGCWWCGARGL